VLYPESEEWTIVLGAE